MSWNPQEVGGIAYFLWIGSQRSGQG